MSECRVLTGGERGDIKENGIPNFVVLRPLPLDHGDCITKRTLCGDEGFPPV